MSYAIVFLGIMYLGYNFLIFKFVDTLLYNPRFKKSYYIPVSIANTCIAMGITMFSECTSFISYLLIGTVLLVDFMLFHKEKVLRCVFCMLACVVHIMAIRSVCVALFAFFMKSSLFAIVMDPFLLVVSSGITALLLNIAIISVIHFVPAKSVKIIKQHKEQLWFMVSWLSVFCMYLLINSNVYFSLNDDQSLLMNQIFAPISILIGTYIVLFFSMKTSFLLGYKEKNEELQHIVEKERQYRTSMDKSLFLSAEIDFTNNKIISGFEDYMEPLEGTTDEYSVMFPQLVASFVHPEDIHKFVAYYRPETFIDAFKQGITEISFDYRRCMQDHTYEWMHVLITLVCYRETESIKGFLQIKNVNEEKSQQIELQYKAERDLLTGLYNKGTSEAIITSRLETSLSRSATGALFIIDIDDFKAINDSLGHLYGDAVLSAISEELRSIFRNDDIVGRIGGDEFIAYAEGLTSKAKIQEKIEKICKCFLRTYANEGNEGLTISSSVGITVFPKDGVDFETLFRNADSALYTSKAEGKNGYSFYEEGLSMPCVSSIRTEIDTNGGIQKRFKDNRIEYVFRLLYGSEDTKIAIESMMELIAKNFGFSRANIFEFNELSTHFNGVFEWCDTNINSVSHLYVNMPVSEFDFVISKLEKSGGMFMSTPMLFPKFAQESYTAIGIKSIVHFSIKERDKLLGVIAFQNCTDDNFSISDTEFEELRTLCQVLSVFMAKRLSNERDQRHHQAIEAIVDNMNSIAYVVDRENYEVFYENQNVVSITGHPSIGKKCYQSYRGLDAPCRDCPLQYLSDENPRSTQELYTKKFDIYTKTSAALIDWSNDQKSLLISSVDVTEYKKSNETI